MNESIERLAKILYALQKIDTTFPLQYAICLAEITLNDGICMTELARRTNMPLSTVSRITSALSTPCKGKGSYALITITISSEERRKKKLSLSDQGHSVMKGIHSIFQDI